MRLEQDIMSARAFLNSKRMVLEGARKLAFEMARGQPTDPEIAFLLNCMDEVASGIEHLLSERLPVWQRGVEELHTAVYGVRS